MNAPHFCQALQRNSNPLKMCSREAPWSTCCDKEPLSRFTGFSSFLYDHSPCRPHSLSHLQQSSPSHAGPAAAIAAARPSGFGIHETEAAEISESASAHHHGVRWVCGRPQIVESWQRRRAQLWIGFRLHDSSRMQCKPLLPRLIHTPP